MRDIHNIYVENSSVNLTKQMYKDNRIKQIFLNFIKEDFPSFLGDIKFRIYDEFDYSEQQIVGEGPEFYSECKLSDFCITYSFTDYTFLVNIHHNGEYGRQIKDYSDEWVQYLTQQLHVTEMEQYSKGLKIFINKLSKTIENQFLSAATNEKQLEI
ncbi:MAG: hypothetical protein IJW59_02200 [Clostridia bacterium]|nr:hypothetical protein [Clostridia bacterium]